ncbi:hypothetical protein PENTCL1PPCAC_16394, partial [Pristionchus entomophagus]
GEMSTPHCRSDNMGKSFISPHLQMVSIVAEVVTISTFKRMFTRNCRLRDNIDNALTLSERYQLTENIRTLKLLTPIIWSHTLLGVIATVIFVIIKPIFPSPEQYPLVEETVSMLYLQGIFMPIIFRYRYRSGSTISTIFDCLSHGESQARSDTRKGTTNRKKKFLAHKSLALLMDLHTFWTFLMCISSLVENSINLYTHLTMRSPSDLYVTAYTCMIRRTPLLLACYGSIFSQLAMAAERYRASINLSGYENSGRSVGYVLNAAHLVAAVFIWALLMSVYGTEWTAAHCTVIRPEGGNVHTMLPVRLSDKCQS